MGWWQERTRTLATRLLDLLGIEPLHERSQAPYRVSNDCVRSISHLAGVDESGPGSRLLRADTSGRLYTVPVGSQGKPIQQTIGGSVHIYLYDASPGAFAKWPGDVLGVGPIRETVIPSQSLAIVEGTDDEGDLGADGLWLVELQLLHSGTDDWAEVGSRLTSHGANIRRYEPNKGQVVYWTQTERYLYIDSTAGDAECLVQVWDLS